MSLGVYLASVPYAVPAFLVGAAVVVLVAGPLARRVGWAAWEVAALGVVVWGYLAVTTTPNPRVAATYGGGRVLDLDANLVSPASLADLRLETSLNVWLTLPLGLVAAYVAARHGRAWPAALALVVPLGAELVQVAFPALGRSAFLLGDVTANWQGVLLGGVVGALLGAAVRDVDGARPRGVPVVD